jgi:membrane fusion protein (multidrug efflux system)
MSATTITPEKSSKLVSEASAKPPVDMQAASAPIVVKRRRHLRLRRALWPSVIVAVIALGYYLKPMVVRSFTTISTDDAYVNGHVTFVAPRVPGKVIEVPVDDNNRVKAGDLLLRIDPEPYEVQVNLKKAAVEVAEANLAAAISQTRALEAQARSQRWKTQTASEQVNNQIALLKARVAALKTQEATLERARSDFERGKQLLLTNNLSKEDFDLRKQNLRVAEASVIQAREEILQVRAALGLPAQSINPLDVPPDLDQTFSAVRTSLAELLQTMSQLGRPLESTDATPKEVIERFRKLDANGDIDRILRDLIPKAPAVVQAQAKLVQARHDLEEAKLNLSYCNVYADIDGTVTRRNVNPGNYVQAGQQVMAVRSIKEIWIDCNFKETQLEELRIGQRVELVVDMYGSKRTFQGRITGFTMGTGSTLALLPPQNATGNFVKVVQRLPVRVELTQPNPEDTPLFIGLSVTPYVYYKEPPTGPNAGTRLQPIAPAGTASAEAKR